MEISEEALARILNGVETVLDDEGIEKEFRRQKLEEVAFVFEVDAETAGGIAQEIVKRTEHEKASLADFSVMDLDELDNGLQQ